MLVSSAQIAQQPKMQDFHLPAGHTKTEFFPAVNAERAATDHAISPAGSYAGSSRTLNTIYVSANKTYSNVTFSAYNEMIIINSTFSNPISLSFVNSTVILTNTEMRLNNAVSDYGAFSMKFAGAQISINGSNIDDNSSANFSRTLMEIQDSSIGVNDSVISATGPIMNSIGTSVISLHLSRFYGKGALIWINSSKDVLMSNDVFVSATSSDSNCSKGASYAVISVSSSNSFIFSGSYLNDSGIQECIALSADNVNRVLMENSLFESGNPARNLSIHAKVAVSVSGGTDVELSYISIYGGTVGVAISNTRTVNASSIGVATDYAGIVANALKGGTISNVISSGGVFAIMLQNCSGISLLGDSVFGSLFGIRIIQSSNILIANAYELNVISAVQFVKSENSVMRDVFAELVPGGFNFAEFYGITLADCSHMLVNNVKLLNAPGYNGGFIDGYSLLFTNDSRVDSISMFFSGNFVSNAFYIFGAFGNSLDSVSVSSEGTYGDAGVVIIHSGRNTLSNASVDLVGTQSLLLQYSNNNTFEGSAWSVHGASPHGIYLYESDRNRFSGTSIASDGIYSETAIVFENASDNLFNDTNVQLTGSFQSALLVQSTGSHGNVFHRFDYFSAGTNMNWIAVSLMVAVVSSCGILLSALSGVPKPPHLRDDEKRLRKMKLR